MELSLLHQKWVRSSDKCDTNAFNMYHSEILRLQDALKTKMDRDGDLVVSAARIPLHFSIQIHIEAKSNIFEGCGRKYIR